MGLGSMLTTIDRLLIRSFLKAYAVCLTSLLALYIVVDLFTNLDDFASHDGGVETTARYIGIYYGVKVFQIFDRLCEAILVLAATFTIAWMRRNNEQIPLLASGISTQRIVRPILFTALCMLSLNMINQELIIPRLGQQLTFQRDDPNGEKEMQVRGCYEPNLTHITGEMATRKGFVIRKFQVAFPSDIGGKLIHLVAAEARYVAPGDEPRSGGWELTGTVPEELDVGDRRLLEQIDKGKFFLRTRKVDFEAMTRQENSYLLSSTYELYDELQNPDALRQGASLLDRKKAVLFHMRLTRPLLSIILVILAMSVILGDSNRNIYISVGVCVIVSALFFAGAYLCKFLGDNNIVAPPMAAWLPVFLFGPIALVKFDAVQT